MKKIRYENIFSMYAHCCELAGRRGWHERSAGGMSVRLDAETIIELEAGMNFEGDYHPLAVPFPELKKEFFLVSGRDAHLEEVERYPDDLSGVIQISPDGDAYRVVLGLGTNPQFMHAEAGAGPMLPTELLEVHLKLHAQRKKKKAEDLSVVYHGTPTNVVALSYLLPPDEEHFSQTLRRSCVQCAKSMKKGLGIVGSLELDPAKLADLTARKMKGHDAVLWSYHGVVCAGNDMMKLIGFMDALDKAAEIRLKIMMVRGGGVVEPELSATNQ